MVVVAEAAAPVVVVAGTHQEVAEGHTPVLATAAVVPMAHGTVVFDDDALLPGLWTLSFMISSQD